MNHRDLLGALDGTRPTVSADGTTPPSGPDARRTGDGGPGHRECSRKGCRQAAAWRLEWNNPRIHAPERRKTWLACPEHREWLTDYLRSRGLLKDVLPLTDPTTTTTASTPPEPTDSTPTTEGRP